MPIFLAEQLQAQGFDGLYCQSGDASFTFGPDMGVAFCPLFSTREEAEEHWPGREIIKVVTSDGDKV